MSKSNKEIILACGCHKVDDQGNVYSKLKQISQKGVYGFKTVVTNEWNKLQLARNTDSGYMQVNIHGKLWRVNRLIAINFIENIENHPSVLHGNGNQIDNRVSNLRWGTAKQNAEDALKHNSYLRGSQNPTSKLTEEKVKEIRENKLKLSRKEFAEKFNVDRSTIDLVINNKIWKHVK